jgi:hypothetical protein
MLLPSAILGISPDTVLRADRGRFHVRRRKRVSYEANGHKETGRAMAKSGRLESKLPSSAADLALVFSDEFPRITERGLRSDVTMIPSPVAGAVYARHFEASAFVASVQRLRQPNPVGRRRRQPGSAVGSAGLPSR